MENNIVDYVSQLRVRNAAQKFYTISRENSKDESIKQIFDGIVSFIQGIQLPEPTRPDELKTKNQLSIENIEKIVCDYYKIDPEKLHLRCRKVDIVKCRFMVCYFTHKYHIAGVVAIGNYFGIDHTSVVHAKKKIKDLADVEEKIRLDMENIKYNIQLLIEKL